MYHASFTYNFNDICHSLPFKLANQLFISKLYQMLNSWHTDGMYAQQWILHMAAFTLVPSLFLFNNLITKNRRTRYLFDTGAHKLSSVNNVNNVYDGVFVGASFEFCFERLYFAQLNFQKGKMGKKCFVLHEL